METALLTSKSSASVQRRLDLCLCGPGLADEGLPFVRISHELSRQPHDVWTAAESLK